ncbi:MAG: choline dehydrogenase-like flavoprotein, partial [Myxococcota bacterium]
LEGNRAVGVEGQFIHPASRSKGAKFSVRARKAVVMAASVTWSPTLLMRSGIKLPAMGHNFRAHPGTGVLGVYEDEVQMNTGATQGWASMKFRENPGLKLETLALPLELVASRLSGGGADLMTRIREFGHLAHWVMAIRAEAVGRVRAGRFGGHPVVSYGFGKPDMIRLRQGMHTVARMHFAAGAKACITGVYGMPYKTGPDEVDSILQASLDPRHWTAILSHLFGGCVMGSDPSRSVCNGRGEVHGIDGLVMADASQIPTTLGVNPQHTIMSLARLRAHQLLEN